VTTVIVFGVVAAAVRAHAADRPPTVTGPTSPAAGAALAGSELSVSFTATSFPQGHIGARGYPPSCNVTNDLPQVGSYGAKDLVVSTRLTGSWTPAVGPPPQTQAPEGVSINWGSDEEIGLPDRVREMYGVFGATTPAGDRAAISFQVGSPRERCPTLKIREQSAIGLAYPIIWRVFASSDVDLKRGSWGCGYARVVSTRSSTPTTFSVTLLLTDVFGSDWDARPSVDCLGGIAIAAVKIPAKSFSVDAKISQRVAFIAKKHVEVHCSVTNEAWDEFENSNFAIGSPPSGATLVGSADAYLPKFYCDPLRKGLKAHGFASAVLALTHEAEHMRGLADENAAECAAWKAFPSVVRQWGKPSKKLMKQLMIEGQGRHEDHLRAARNVRDC
jgi:hypothetical protein